MQASAGSPHGILWLERMVETLVTEERQLLEMIVPSSGEHRKRGKRGHLDSAQAARSRPGAFRRAAAIRAGVSVAMTSGSVTPGRTVSSSLR